MLTIHAISLVHKVHFQCVTKGLSFLNKINLPPDSSEFGIFYDQSDKLKKLVKSRNYLGASKYSMITKMSTF